MKLVSPKTLLASLLSILFIVMKAMTFGGMHDLIWIALFGYLTIKGIHVAFSQEAYDEDVKTAYRGKALYRDLFGKFAYIAVDVPLITILLAGLLAAFCSVTTALKVILGVLLMFAVGYAIWVSWYISKHKRLRMESGEWGAAVLSEEDEKAWRRSDLWHNIVLGIIVLLGVLYLIFGDPIIYINNGKLEDTLTGLSTDSVTLEEVVPFEWTTVYTFDPYTSIERIERITGSKSPALKESVSEGMTHFVFMNRGRVAASVCAYPSNIGYSLSFTGGKNTYYDYPDGGYSHIEYGDQVEFEVTQDEGIVRLHAYVERFEAEVAPQAGNDLWGNAAPSLSALRFDRFDGESGWFGWLHDQEREKEILTSLSTVDATIEKDWTPDKISFPVYGIEIGTEDGWGILAAWTNGHLIMRDGSVYRFDYDFSHLESGYSWERVKTYSSITAVPCSRYLVQYGDRWLTEYLKPAEVLNPPEDIVMSLISVTDGIAKISLSNTGLKDWTYGEDFYLNVLIDHTWYNIPTSPVSNWVFPSINIHLDAGKVNEELCYLDRYGTLPPGTYRIVKEGMSAEFSI